MDESGMAARFFSAAGPGPWSLDALRGAAARDGSIR